MRYLPHFEASLEYLVHKLDRKPDRTPDSGAREQGSVDARKVRDDRVENDHPGRRRAKP